LPVREYALSKVTRGLRTFLNLKVGLTRDVELAELREIKNGAGTGGPRPENIVWIFGDGRTGSTWLMRMVEELAMDADALRSLTRVPT
jgi:hypothetical protein